MRWPWLAGRSGLVAAVLLCAAGAALVLPAAGRTWLVDLQPRPAPLPDAPTPLTGADLLPWLPALGWAALAAAGALLVLGGRARMAVGGLLVVAGVVMAAGAAWGIARPDGGPGWPALALVGALAVVVAGCLGAVGGHHWPSMGARYERAPPAGAERRPVPERRPLPERRPAAERRRDREKEMWDALDRGEDPTS